MRKTAQILKETSKTYFSVSDNVNKVQTILNQNVPVEDPENKIKAQTSNLKHQLIFLILDII
jgi:hypothetical protein